MHGMTMAKSGQLLEEKQWFDIRRDFPIKTKDNTYKFSNSDFRNYILLFIGKVFSQ